LIATIIEEKKPDGRMKCMPRASTFSVEKKIVKTKWDEKNYEDWFYVGKYEDWFYERQL
jgi:hypothetical protein